MPRKKRPSAVDLYCGCGGATEGLKKFGFRVVAAVDNDEVACRTYRKNHPGTTLYTDDIRRIKPSRIKSKDLKGASLGLLVVCAPCQPFSSQNKKRARDKRADLILEAIRFAKTLKPRVIFFENVPGLAKNSHSRVLTRLRKGLKSLGYGMSKPAKVDAADYGIPQRRRRCIMVAVRGQEKFKMPPAITPEGRRITVRDAIGKLKRLRAGEAHPRDPLHRARLHSPMILERLRHVPKDGGSRKSLPKRLRLKCHNRSRGHEDVYGRMAWDDVAPTLTTGCTDMTKGRYAHPRDDRAITLREAARLQSFRSKYKFTGSVTDISRQIGNAVPPKLIRVFADPLKTLAMAA